MRFFTAMLAAGLLSLPAPVADAAEATGSVPAAQQGGPLKPGRSAGVRAAQVPRTGLALIGASAIIAVVVVAASSGGSSNSNGNGPQSNFQSVPTTTP
ncbi:MAG TPA: hypothetical protein VN175_10775 [Rhizomicrobium sp.]|nr:hypothetical protein [Rhizomicrobium sp.]